MPQHLVEHKVEGVAYWGRPFNRHNRLAGSVLEIVLECCQMLHNTACSRCNRSRGPSVRVCSVWIKKMKVVPSPDHLTQSSKAYSSVWGASEMLYLTAVSGTFNAKSCKQNDTVVMLYKNDVLK